LARARGLVADQPHPGKERASMATATAARPTSCVRTALRPKRPRAKWFLTPASFTAWSPPACASCSRAPGSRRRLPRWTRVFLTDGLALRALALVHALDAVPAIEKALKGAREK